MTADELTALQHTLTWTGVLGGFAGGLIGQLLAGAFYLRRVVKLRCSNHARRLEQLEGKAIGNVS